MPATQHHALTHNPNHLDLQLVASYPRRIEASLTRVWENVLDWEHLPHLHDSAFSYSELDEAGLWGWRVWSSPDRSGYFELVVDTNCYVVRSYTGGEQFSEIWTHLSAQQEATDIRVEFYSAGVDDDNRDGIGEMYLALYKVLWDEDEAMMQQRQLRLDNPRADVPQVNLGDASALRQNGPHRFELNRREYLLGEQGGSWLATPTICPHLLGPLEAAAEPGQLRCPWHGYVFDIETGKCLTPADARCTLARPPILVEEGGELIARSHSENEPS